tara:strand:- start:97 stop:639 length:543 start_codon:yes stop_codon:yes gene_type:complete
MHSEELTKISGISYKVPGSYFNIVNFTPVIKYIHNISMEKISEFDSELKIKNTQHKKYIFHYFIFYTCEILKIHNKKFKPVIYYDNTIDINMQYLPFLDAFRKKFPVIVIQQDFSVQELKKKMKCSGYAQEFILILMRRLKKIQNTTYYFNKLHYFCKKYDLTFLDKTYFEDIRNKLSLL